MKWRVFFFVKVINVKLHMIVVDESRTEKNDIEDISGISLCVSIDVTKVI